jgi:predicted transcriptional regulator
MTHPNARQSEIEREARRARVAALLLAGVRDQTRIAEQLGVSQPTISRDIKAIEARWAQEAVQDIAAAKGQDLERIERLIQALWQDAIRGKWLATDRVLNLMQHRAKLLGLEAPKNVNITLEVQRLVEKVAAEDGMTNDEREALFAAVQKHLEGATA